MSFREVNEDDILKDLYEIRDESLGCNLSDSDREHEILIDEISEKILNNVSGHSIEYVKKQLDLLDENLLDYLCYWNEKYYRNGFMDGVKIILGCFKE